MDVKDKVIIVTGGSSGIGLATAKLLAAKHARVVIAARDKVDLEKAAKDIPGALAIQTDMSKPDDIKNLINKTVAKFKTIDVVINNAGQAAHGRLEDFSLDEFRNNLEVNLLGPAVMMQQVIPVMRQHGGGAIVNIGSGTTKMALPGVGVYSSIKSALSQLSHVARAELKEDNIVVSLVHPYITATNFGKDRHATLRRPTWQSRPGVPPADPPEKVAEVILEILKTGDAEISMVPAR